jgi:hypothetical protein
MQWKNIGVLQRDTNGYEKGYQSRSNVVKAEKSKMRAFSCSMLNRCKSDLCQALDVRGISACEVRIPVGRKYIL